MITKTPFEDRLLARISPVAAGLGLEVVRVRVMGGTRRKRLQVMAERPDGGMSAENCATLSRALSAVFDVEDPFDGEWDLEVSSPGIDRPLTRLEDFARWRGFAAKIELDRMVEGRKRFSGELVGVDGEAVLIDLSGDAAGTAELPFAWIADAKLVLTDELVAESLRRRPSLASEDDLGDPDIEIDYAVDEDDLDDDAPDPDPDPEEMRR